MDSTPVPKPPSSSSSSASKLPIKRKAHQPQFLLSPKPEPTTTAAIAAADFDSKPPPFKFHRIWTQPDEIRFLQGLLDSLSHGLSFPRDLPIFYQHFSSSLPQPYSKSQLSEKLRRLRKKFRVTSSRLARGGLSSSLLSPHDRALFDLSKKLWSPEFASVSPFGGNKSVSGNYLMKSDDYDGNLVGVKVIFSPVLPVSGLNVGVEDFDDDDDDDDDDDANNNDGNDFRSLNLDNYDDGHVGKVNEECELDSVSGGNVGGCGAGDSGAVKYAAAKSVLDVFDECLREVKLVVSKERVDNSRDGKEKDFKKRWRDQRVAEFDALARRLRLHLDNSLNRH